jgi:thiamine monophosphate kinase
VAIDVVTDALPVNPRLVEVASALGRNPLEWALTGGDDHALAATFPGDRRPPAPWKVIGRVARGRGVVVDGEGRVVGSVTAAQVLEHVSETMRPPTEAVAPPGGPA